MSGCGGYYCEDRSCERCKAKVVAIANHREFVAWWNSTSTGTLSVVEEKTGPPESQHEGEPEKWQPQSLAGVAGTSEKGFEKCLAASPPPAAAPRCVRCGEPDPLRLIPPATKGPR